MKKLFLIIGAPGSGKTTDAELIAKHMSDVAVHFSTGDLLRLETSSGSAQGKLIESYTSTGNLVPLEIVVQTIIKAIKDTSKNIILLDGYPRSVEQMLELDKVLKEDKSLELVNVIEVQVSEQTARDRVLGRARGADDNDEVFNNRMKVFLDPLDEIEKFYKKDNLLELINGERTIEEIVAQMQAFIQSRV